VTGPVADAYDVCQSITKARARNFYYGIRLLPADKRKALCAVYALARRIDDVGDGYLPAELKAAALADLRTALKDLEAGGRAPEAAASPGGSDRGPLPGRATGTLTGPQDPVLAAVADSARHYPIPLGAFTELVDGVEMDVLGRRFETFDDLVEYARCVAGSIGRLCLGIFGSRPHPDAARYADSLGIALQQTNILRDIREDLLNGRVYLPQEDLDGFGVELALDEHGALMDKDGGLTALIRFSARRAQEWYADGMRLVPLLDHRSAACCAAMAGIYRRLLEHIAANPAAVFDRRLSLSARQKIGVAARALAGRAS
jgi:phytoene synthase